LKQGLDYQKRAEYEVAIRWFLKAISRRPNDFRSLLGVGYCYLMIGMYWQSKKYLLESLKHHPSNARLFGCLADLYFALDEYEMSIFYLTKSLEMDPSNSHKQYCLGIFYRKWAEQDFSFGKIFRALECQIVAIKLDSKNLNARLEQVKLYTLFGWFKDAVLVLEPLALEYPDHFDIHYDLGVCLYAEEKYGRALYFFRKAKELDPSQAYVQEDCVSCQLKLVPCN
jgi:tetratricopeptide (TPR) repeat protein